MYVYTKNDMNLRELIDNYLYGYSYGLAEYFWEKGLSNLLLRYIVNYYGGHIPTTDDVIECLENSDIDDVLVFGVEGRIRK